MKKLTVYTDLVTSTAILSDAEMGRLVRAMLKYASDGQDQALSGNERFLWGMVKADIDRQMESYLSICSINKANASKRTVPNRSEVSQSATVRTEPTQEKKRKERKGKDSIDTFDVFWSEYPKKASKQVAEKSWAKLNPDNNLLQTILEDVRAKKKSVQWTKDGGQYIPMPATYINQKRWQDEPVTVQTWHGFDEHETNGLDRLLVNLDEV